MFDFKLPQNTNFNGIKQEFSVRSGGETAFSSVVGGLSPLIQARNSDGVPFFEAYLSKCQERLFVLEKEKARDSQKRPRASSLAVAGTAGIH